MSQLPTEFRQAATYEDRLVTSAIGRWVKRRAELGSPVPKEVIATLTRAGIFVGEAAQNLGRTP
jgi:hypothetical protein